MENLTQEQIHQNLNQTEKNMFAAETIEFKAKLNSNSFLFTAKTKSGLQAEFYAEVTKTGKIRKNSVRQQRNSY